MQRTKITNKEDARQKAIDWQQWQSTQSLFYSELAEWADYFRQLGAEFGLTEEFVENGII